MYVSVDSLCCTLDTIIIFMSIMPQFFKKALYYWVAYIHSVCCKLHMIHEVNVNTFISLPNLKVLIDSTSSTLYEMTSFCVYLIHMKNLVRGKNVK